MWSTEPQQNGGPPIRWARTSDHAWNSLLSKWVAAQSASTVQVHGIKQPHTAMNHADTDTQEDDTISQYLDAQRPGEDGPAPIDKRQRQVQPLVKGEETINIPSPTMDPGIIAAIKGAQDADVKQWVQPAVSALEAVYGAMQQIITARQAAHSDSTLTEDGATLKIAAFAERMQTQATQRIDTAHSTLSKSIEEYEGILRRPMEGQASAGPLAAEIRAHCKALSAGERAQFLSDATKRQDTRTMAAILGAPSYLSGITDDTQHIYTEQFNRIKAPEVAKRIEVLKEARERLEKAGALFLLDVQRAGGFKWQKVQKLRAAKAQADKAFAV